MQPTQLIYLHGFNSSPQSAKAQDVNAYFHQLGIANQLSIPALPLSPKSAITMLESLIAQFDSAALVGSSLGGFYATWLAEKYQLKAALINPAVRPWNLLGSYTGVQHNYHTGDAWELKTEWVDELKAFEVTQPSHAQNLLLLTQTGDETLDWQAGWSLYRDAHLYKGLGGSHRFDDFDVFIPLVLRFCGII